MRSVLVLIAQHYCRTGYRACTKLAQHQRTFVSAVDGTGGADAAFDLRLLDRLVCPLSKAPLRWDAAARELVCDELGIAYPVINGMPNLRPADGRVIEVGDRDAGPLAQPWGDDADAAGIGQRQPLQASDAKPQ